MTVLANRACLFIAKKLKSFQESGYNIITGVVSLLILLIVTIISFSLINYGLYQIDHSSFNITSEPSFFNFIYYSFNAFLLNSVNEIIPVSSLAKSAVMISYLFDFFLVGIVFSLMLSFKTNREERELEQIIIEAKDSANNLERYIVSEFEIADISKAMEKLEETKAQLVEFIYKISKQL